MTLRQRYWFSGRKLELAFALQVFERIRAVIMGLAPMEMCPLSSAAHIERSQVSASRAPNNSCISFPDFQVSDNPAQTGRKYIPAPLASANHAKFRPTPTTFLPLMGVRNQD